MTEEPLKNTLLRLLSEVAPDVDVASIAPDKAFRDQFDFDSMDCLNFAIALHKEFGIDIPEADYPHLGSLDGCIRYLHARQSAESCR